MVKEHETIKQLTEALHGLLTVEDTTGRRILYQESADGEHSYCEVCAEVDSHKAGCRVGVAEDALRDLQRSE